MSKTVQFTDTSTNANTYYWQFGDGNTSGDRNPIHTYEEYGDYVVILTITDNNGNSDEFQQNVSLSLPNVDEPPVDETTEDTTIEETTDEETSYEDETEDTAVEETTTTFAEQKPSGPPSGYQFAPPVFNLMDGTLSPQGQWIWDAKSTVNPMANEWVSNSSTTTTTTTTTTTESDDSDTGGNIPTFNYTLSGKLANRDESNIGTTFDIEDTNYPSLVPEISNYINVPGAIIANGNSRTILSLRLIGNVYKITIDGVVGSENEGGGTTRYNFSINITSSQDLGGGTNNNNDGGDNEDTGLGGRGGDDDDGGIGYEPPK